MRVRIDGDRCQGSGFCVRVNNELFSLPDPLGPAVVCSEEVPEHLAAAAREARDLCPTAAVVIHESEEARTGGTERGADEPVTRVTRFSDVEAVLRSRMFTQGIHQQGQVTFPFQGGTLVARDGDSHFELRRLESPLFGKRAIAQYAAVADAELETVLDRVLATADDDGVARTDLLPTIRRVLVSVSAAVVGLDGADSEEACNRLMDHAEQLGYGSIAHAFTSGADEVVEKGLVAKSRFVSEFLEPSRERRALLLEQLKAGLISENDLPDDVLTLHLRTRYFGSDYDQFVREAIQYVVGSTSTTVHATSHAVRELAGWLDDHPKDRSLLADRAFIQQVVNEALRLTPPSPELFRRATEDTEVAGQRIHAGERILLDVKAANRDQDTFGPDADRFDPHRRLEDVSRPFGLAFGGGRHICMGRLMAAGVRAGLDEGTTGVLPQLIRGLFRAGLTLDPLNPPQLRSNTVRATYTMFPVIFRTRATTAPLTELAGDKLE